MRRSQQSIAATRRLRSGLWAGGLLLLFSTGGIVMYVHVILSDAVDRLVREQAIRSSVQWEKFFQVQLTDVEGAFATRTLGLDQLRMIDSALLYGDVFRFKMFAPNGTLFFTSDEADNHNPPKPGSMTIPQQVFLTGVKDVTLKDGSDTPNRPDLYAEAYVPAHAPDGSRIGVLEIYIDQTSTKRALEATFHPLHTILPLLAVLIYVLPSLGLLVVVEQKRRRDLRLESARYDPLTRTLTRSAFFAEAQEIFENRKNRPEQIGLLFIDVDHFKAVNDTLGHAAGDAHLRGVAAAIRNVSRLDDILGRYGGDEFVMVMPGIGRDALEQRADQICVAVRQAGQALDSDISRSVSIGTHVARTDEPFELALDRADQALYTAKHAGRDCYAVFDANAPAPPAKAVQSAA